MKKPLAILVVTVMALSAIIPLVSANGDDATGSIYYDPAGGAAPVKILAIWETISGSVNDPLDDDLYTPGCQVDPPMTYDGYSQVWIYVAILDPENDVEFNEQIKIDISWPMNDVMDRPDLGDGSWAADNLHPVLNATWDEYLAAVAIDGGANNPFICYYNEADDGGVYDGYDYVEWRFYENKVIFKKAKYEPYYHDPAGWYDANVTIQASSTDVKTNYFEYVLGIGVELDFDHLNWGDKSELQYWYQYEDGNWIWDDTEDPPLPTIRSIGNWDTKLGAHFNSGDFDPNDILFDVRVGDANVVSPRFNESYVEANAPTDHPDGHVGMYHCINYWPIPIDNYNELQTDYYQDALLKCHMAKMDFRIFIIQWTHGPHYKYTFDINVLAQAPSWLPAEGSPCG